MGVPKVGVLFGGPNIKDYNMLQSFRVPFGVPLPTETTK